MNSLPTSAEAIPADASIIKVRLQDLNRLFDLMDPAPLYKQDLHPNVAEHIVESAREFPARARLALVLHVDQAAPQAPTDQAVSDATRAYFAHRSTQAQRKLRLHLRRGVISLIIGLAFLATTLTTSQLLGTGSFATTLRHSLEIGGWVALWRPLEMFLYDWWPILGDKLFYRRLARMPVQIKYAA